MIEALRSQQTSFLMIPILGSPAATGNVVVVWCNNVHPRCNGSDFLRKSITASKTPMIVVYVQNRSAP